MIYSFYFDGDDPVFTKHDNIVSGVYAYGDTEAEALEKAKKLIRECQILFEDDKEDAINRLVPYAHWNPTQVFFNF